MVDQAHYYLSDTITFDQKATSKFLTPTTRPLVEKIRSRLTSVPTWSEHTLEPVFTDLMQEEQLKNLGQLAQPVRVALTGGTVSPGIFEVMAVLGRERTLARLERASAVGL